MSLENSKPPRKPIDVPRDKPRSDRIEHANLDERPGATLHPRAQAWRATPATGSWGRQLQQPSWR